MVPSPSPPYPPRMPSFEELLGVELQAKPVKHTGLLYELLGGSPMPIYNDAQAHPEKYQPEDIAALEAVISRGPAARGSLSCGCPSEHWELNDAERHRLDQMTLTFATAKRIEPPAAMRRHTPARAPKKVKETVAEEMPSFWWLKGQ